MENSIVVLRQSQVADMINSLEKNKFVIANVDGNTVNNRDDFFVAVETALQFPGKCEGLFSRFDDWIMDLGWIEKEKGICIIITSFANFSSDDIAFKSSILEDFEEDILPFWEEEVCSVVKDGTPREFYVILVE